MRGKENGPRAVRGGRALLGYGGKIRPGRNSGLKPKGRGKSFFFLFQKDFESSFEFGSNHSIQKIKCSSINAQ
jgi:hypothetical protein